MSDKEKSTSLHNVSEVIKFEQWIRFYYIKEEDESKLFVDIPDDVMKSIEDDLPHLAGLAQLIDKEEINYEKSCETVCSFIGSRLDTSLERENLIPSILDSKEFKIEMYMFNLWIKAHEALLDEAPKSFPEWVSMYAEWLGTEQVSEYKNQLITSSPTANEPMDGKTH